MKLNEEQIERANTVNLPQFLMQNGFDLKRVGREFVWKEHDSLHIRDNAPGERGVWHRFSTDEGGDNIAFLRTYMGMDFVQAVEALNGEHYDRSYTPQQYTHTPKQQKGQAQELVLSENSDSKRVFAYLCKTRGLDYNLVKDLVQSGVIAQEQKTGNVLFKYYDDNGKVIGAEKVGTSTEHKFKGIATGSASGYGFEVCRGNGEKAFFFESAIDMLSYLQMFSPDNCRLVSMMGVKPQTVIDTMERYDIAPQNVYLCSDNDEAGNDFANRLISEYPDMKRIVTPDTYKDWNDMLRGTSKKEIKAEQQTIKKKEADRMPVQTYGNEFWNKATNNEDKRIITAQAADFPQMQKQLEDAGMNYCAYYSGNSVMIAVNRDDVDKLRQMFGVADLEPNKSKVDYIPPEKNIIGNAEYRYIPQKEYISADRDLILKVADRLAKENIQFSGRIYPTGKGTLTVSHNDLYRVREIRDTVINQRRQIDNGEKGQAIGNRSVAVNNRQLYLSTLTPKQYEEVKPFIETNAHYSGVIRDGKVMFAVDRSEAQSFHRALETAKREVGLIHNMQDKGLPMEQMVALSPLMHRLAVEDAQLNLPDFFDKRYDEAQFGEMLSLVNAYLDQPTAERFGEHSKLNDMLEAKSSFDRAIELSDFFSQRDFSDEQRAAVTAMFVGDVTRGQIECIDETFTVEDIQQYSEILHTALNNSEITDYLEQHKQAVIERENADKEPTEEEVLFGKANLAKFIAEGTLSSDEWEDLSYPLFEDGYIDKHKASEKASFGYALPESELYALANKMHSGEDIRSELAHKLMGKRSQQDIEFVFEGGEISDRTFYYSEGMRHNLHAEYGEDSVKLSFGGMEREVTFNEIGQAFLDRIEEEHKDILHFRTMEELEDVLPDVSEDTRSDLITAFENKIMHGWENGENKVAINRIKKALYDILGTEEQTEKAFAAIAKEMYNVSFEPEIPDNTIDMNISTIEDWVDYRIQNDIIEGYDYREQIAQLSDTDKDVVLARVRKEAIDNITKAYGSDNIKSAWDNVGKSDFSDQIDDYITSCVTNSFENALNEMERGQSPIHFGLLGNGVTAYDISRTDPETNDYPIVAHISPEGVIKIYDDAISDDDMAKINDEARSLRESFMAEWNALDTTAQLSRLYDRVDTETLLNMGKETLSAEEKIAKYMPFVFFGEGERPQPEMAEKPLDTAVESIKFIGDRNGFEAVKNAAQNSSFGTIIADGDTLTIVINDNADVKDVRHIVETAQDNGVFLNKPSAKLLESRFGADFMQEAPHKPTVADLAVGDVIMFDGSRREVEEISERSIKLRDLDAPDFGGILLGTSDVYSYNGWQDDMNAKGFEILSKAEPKEEAKGLGPVTMRKVGDFFEMYGKNAEIAAEVLDLHLTKKNGSPMVGFPEHVKGEYADKLREAGYTILEEQAFELNPPKLAPLDKAKNIIYDFCVSEYNSEADFSDLSDVHIAYTTLTDNELPIQVTADLEKFRILYEFDGEVFKTEQYDSIDDMVENGLTGLDFNDLIYVPDEVIERHTLDKTTFFLQASEEDIAELKEHLSMNGYNAVWADDNKSFDADSEQAAYIETILEDRAIIYSLDGKAFDAPEETVELMSDADRVHDTPAQETVSPITIDFKGDSESLDEIKDLALSLGATCTLIASGLVVDTYENHKDELLNKAYELSVSSTVRDNSFIDEITRAVEAAHADDEPTPERFEVRENGKTFGIWDNIRDEFYPDKNGEPLAYPTKEEAETGFAEVKKAVEDKEAEEWLYMERSRQGIEPKQEVDDDAPLFADADLIDKIQENEKADVPFWESPDIQGEQLSFFGDSEPVTSKQQKTEKPKSEFSTGPIVDGVQVYEALAAEIDRGTGFVNGKLRVQEFYDEQHPTVQQLADFLKKAYGIGGHSGEGNISIVSTDGKGMTFDFENGEKFRHSWYNVATMTDARLRDNTYLSAEQQEKYAEMRAEKTAETTLNPVDSRLEENNNAVNVGDKFRNKMTGEISEVISLEGALPYYTDDCTVRRESGSFAITENIRIDKLLDERFYERISDTERTAEVEKPEPVKAETEQTADMPKPKNLSQLKKAIQSGMMFEIIDHHKRDRIGERRVVTGKNTANFTSKRLDENNQPYGDDIYMDWDKAANWRFDGDKITAMMSADSDTVLMSFRFVNGREHEKTAEVSVPEVDKADEELDRAFLSQVIGKLNNHYDEMYQAHDNVDGFAEAVDVGDQFIKDNPDFMGKLADLRHDIISSDREIAALAFALVDVGLLEKFVPESEKAAPEITPEKSEPELSVGDFIEYKGKEYKVESLELDGFITLNDTALDGKVQDRVTFIAEEFLSNAEFKLIEPKTEDIPEKTDNFTITDDSLGEGGAKTKFRNNIEAIKMLKMLEEKNLPAYPEAKEVLSKYVGWGGLAQAFDKSASSWSAEYSELKELLTPQEYRQAQASTLDAFYTSPAIISGIYDALDNFGFVSGNVLEPSMGIGNFFGCMPERMRVDSDLYGVELDSISGRIAQMLYPYADIAIQGFEKNAFQNGCFDVAVGNVPFGDLGFTDSKHNTSKLHDYFFAETLDKVRKGEIRVLLGSTAKMGTGTNVQDKLIAVHDLDIPWRPADLDQRAGRIIRQGNQNKNVEIYRYVTKGTFDAYSYQTLENKQKFISQIMTSKEPARKCEDVDQQALTYSEIKALCTGDERIKEKLVLDNEVKELKTLAAEYANTVYEMEDKIKAFPMKEEQLTATLEHLQADRKALKALPIDPETKLPVFKITISDTEYTDRKEAAKALEDAALAIRVADTPVKVGSFQGFDLSITVHSPAMGGGMSAQMQGQHTHSAKLISSFAHNLNRIEAGLYNIDRRIDSVKNSLSKLRVDYDEAQKIVATPFPQQAELESKSERLETLTQALNLAAIEAKKNAPKREQTCYFQRAQLKREAARVAKKKSAPKKTKGQEKKKPGLE